MDIKTLFAFISISGICVLGLSVYVYCKHSRFTKGSLYWLGAILAISMASILFSLGGVMPARFNIHLSNSLLLLCPTLMSLSFRRLYNVGSPQGPLILYAVSFLAFNLAAPVASVNERIILFSSLFGILWLDPSYLILRREGRESDRLLGYAFLFASVCAFLRAGGTLLYEENLDSLLEGGVLQKVYIIAMGMELFFFLAGYILMLNSRYFERIQTNEATLRAAIDNSPYAMVMTDLSGQVVSINPTFEKITGYTLPEIQSHGLRALQAGHDERDVSEGIWSTLREGGDWEGELQNKRKDGSRFWEKAVWSPVRTERGEVTGFFGVTADITERRQLEDFKQEIEHLMRHDLKSPLNAIIGMPKLIEIHGALNARQKEFLAYIQEGGESMLEQINRSLEMYSIEEGTYLARPETTDLRQILTSLCKSLHPLAEGRHVAVHCRYEASERLRLEAPVLLSTDQPLLRRLLGNLLKNAIEASPERGVVDVQVSVETRELRIDLHNEGAIPPTVKSRFFTKFNTSGKFQSTGLGAYSAKLIADLLGYAITFDTDDATGTTLSISIPSSHLCKQPRSIEPARPVESVL